MDIAQLKTLIHVAERFAFDDGHWIVIVEGGVC